MVEYWTNKQLEVSENLRVQHSKLKYQGKEPNTGQENRREVKTLVFVLSKTKQKTENSTALTLLSNFSIPSTPHLLPISVFSLTSPIIDIMKKRKNVWYWGVIL